MKGDWLTRLSLYALLLLLVLCPAVTLIQDRVREQSATDDFEVPVRTAYTARISADNPTDASIESVTLRRADSLSQLFVVPADDPLAALLALRMCGPPENGGLIIVDADEPLTEEQLNAIDVLAGEDPRLTPIGDIPEGAAEQLESYIDTQGFTGTGGELAVAVDAHLRKKKGTAERVLMVPMNDMDFALTAGTWIARTGDAVFPIGRNAVCPEVADHLRDRQEVLSPHKTQNLYLLGPRTAASNTALEELGRFGQAVRVAGPTPEDQALALARFHDDGTQMGWDGDTPQDGDCTYFVGSNARPGELLATAQLSADGPCGPILLTSAETLPPEMESFLWALGPAGSANPSHGPRQFAWIAGDAEAVSGEVQSDLDRINAAASAQVRQVAAFDVLAGAWLITALIGAVWVWIHSSVRRPDMAQPVRLLWVLSSLVLGLFGVAGYFIAQKGERPPVTTRQRTCHATQALTVSCKTASLLTAFAVLTALLWTALGRQLWILPPPFALIGRPEIRALAVGYLLALLMSLLLIEPSLLAQPADGLWTRVQRILPATVISITGVAAVFALVLRWLRWDLLPVPAPPTAVLWYGTASAAALLAAILTYPLQYWIMTGAMEFGTLE